MLKNNTNEDINKIQLMVIAESEYEKYIQNIYLDKLQVNDKPTTIILNQIPYQELEFYGNGIARKYKTVLVKLISINDEDIDTNGYKISPMYNALLHNKWKRKWGVNWNLEYLKID